MKKVNTVLGPIDVDQLGRTLVHEHLYIAFYGSELDRRMNFDRPSFISEAVKRLQDLRGHGVSTFVDPCPIELGRDVGMMTEISERAGMNIICTTGFYLERMGLPFYWRARTVEEIAAFYIDEIEHGIGNTGIKPGAIKCATGAPIISALEEKFLEAASIAQRATGLPIITHTEHVCGPEQQDIFRKNGVPLQRCLIGHSCGNADPSYHRKIVTAGSYIGFDRIGIIHQQPDEVRADNIARLVRDGFGAQILMSQDRYCFLRGPVSRPLNEAEKAKIEALKAAGKWPPPYTHLFSSFIPMLKERGLSDEQIWPILDRNPKEFFRGTSEN